MRDSGKVLGVLVGILIVVLIVGLIGFLWYKSGYDRAVAMDESVTKAWADVDAQLQRRLELIPNLVNTVKGYATHEKELFESIAQSREKYFQGSTPAEKMQASNQLTGLLSRLLVLKESYPELKANQNFLGLQDSLEGTENRIAVARTRYNEAVGRLNSYKRSLFGAFFCRKAGVEAREYFEATEQAQTQVPQVEF